MKVDVRARSAGVFAAGLTVVGLLAAGAPGVAQASSPANTPTYLRANVKTGGGEPSQCYVVAEVHCINYSYKGASVSDDGRFTVFSSNAEDLVPGDTNRSYDVFLRDSVNDVTTRISVSSSGQQGVGEPGSTSWKPSMSADGRYIVFESYATNLVPGDTNDARDVFLRDTVAGVTTRVSLTANGEQNTRESTEAAISPDGRFVVFASSGALVADDTDSQPDVYLRELATGRTVRISETYDGQPVRFPFAESAVYQVSSLAVASGGRHVVFVSDAENLVPGDTNRAEDVFVRDVAAGTTVRASVTEFGAQIARYSNSPSMSADGRYVAFVGRAPNIVPGTAIGTGRHVYLRDLVLDTTTLVSLRGLDAIDGTAPSISSDGRRVAFESLCCPGGKDQYDIFLRDLHTGTTRLVTVSPTGGDLDGDSRSPKLSVNGRHLAFESTSSGLVDVDTTSGDDIFVRLNVL